jgi:type IV pilus assembly protein PilP
MMIHRLARFIQALGFPVLLLFVYGCESQPPPVPPAPEVVRQKISMASEPATAPSETAGNAGTGAEAAAAAETGSQPPAASPSDMPVSTEAKELPAQQDAQPPAAAAQNTQNTVIAVVKTPAPDRFKSITDPFEPLFKEETPEKKETVRKKARKRRAPQTPLERVDLGQLTLTAIIQTPKGNKALVEEASGKGYIIEKGTYIGVHSGRVVDILGDRVLVEEEFENAIGELTTTKRELKFPKPLGE